MGGEAHYLAVSARRLKRLLRLRAEAAALLASSVFFSQFLFTLSGDAPRPCLQGLNARLNQNQYRDHYGKFKKYAHG